jgi:hypothetical protein
MILFILLLILIILLSINIIIYGYLQINNIAKTGGNYKGLNNVHKGLNNVHKGLNNVHKRLNGIEYKIIYIEKDSEEYAKFKKRNDSFNNFYKIINCPHFKTIEDILSTKCIKLPSIYDQCKKVKKNGLELCILKKGSYIYKTFNGFMTEKMEKDYLDKNPNGISWYGNIYASYNFAKSVYGGLNVYILTKDIILFDYFNYNNLKILINYLYKNKCNKYLINNIKLYTGFQISKEKQYKKYKEFYQVDKEIVTKLFKVCDKTTLSARNILKSHEKKGGYFIYVNKE